MFNFNMPGMDTPEGQGLMAAAMSLLQAQKMPGQRGMLANALGQAGQQYMQTRTSAQDMAERRKFQDLQMRMYQDRLTDEQAQRARAEQARQLFGKYTTQPQPENPADPVMGIDATPARPAGFDLPGYAMALGSVDPGQAINLLGSMRKDTKRHALSPGQVLVDDAGQTIAQVPDKPAPPEKEPEAIRQLKIIYGDGTPAYKAALARLGQKATTHQPGTNVSVNNVTKQEGEEAKTVGKFYGDAFADIQKAGFTAQSTINRYTRLKQLLDGVNTGTFAPTGLEIAKAANSLGLKIDPGMQNKEAAQALTGEIALQLRNPSGGAGMPGAMSDADRQFLINMVPGLSTTPEGRALMVETAIKLATRDQQVAALARAYRQKNGSINEGFYEELAKFAEKNPLFQRSQGAGLPSADAIDAELRRRRGGK